MKGVPKKLNSKGDYLYMKDNFSRDVWEPLFRDLLSERTDWYNEGEIVGEGITDSTHKVFEDEKGNKYQFVLKTEANPILNHIGWSKEEVSRIIEGA